MLEEEIKNQATIFDIRINDVMKTITNTKEPKDHKRTTISNNLQ